VRFADLLGQFFQRVGHTTGHVPEGQAGQVAVGILQAFHQGVQQFQRHLRVSPQHVEEIPPIQQEHPGVFHGRHVGRTSPP
jgi:hypothetical protein